MPLELFLYMGEAGCVPAKLLGESAYGVCVSYGGESQKYFCRPPACLAQLSQYLMALLRYCFVHVSDPIALVYVPMPPAKYLSRKSPSNEDRKKRHSVIHYVERNYLNYMPPRRIELQTRRFSVCCSTN